MKDSIRKTVCLDVSTIKLLTEFSLKKSGIVNISNAIRLLVREYLLISKR